jgi:hypothetical protein
MLNELTARDTQFHDTEPSRIIRVGRHALAVDEHRDEFEPTLWTGTPPPNCDIRQVWFAGAHSDVGGGYQDHRLADIPLRWMADEAKAAGLLLDEHMLPAAAALDPLASQHESRLNWSRKDRLTPTIRQVCGYVPQVSVLERLWTPLDGNGKAQTVINEALHPSLRQRLGRPVITLADDSKTTGPQEPYRPKNLR